MSEIDKRIFVVGCSRSGTTLLQVLLASHPDIKSFPETNFFWSATGDKRRYLARLGLPTGLESKALKDTVDLLELDQEHYSIPSFFPTFRSAVDRYISLLDDQALEDKKSMWLEKTPLHVCRLSFIEMYVSEPLFVHIIRDGRDVVASICHRAREYPDRFGWQSDPNYGIDLWNRAINRSKEYAKKCNHFITTYDRVTQNTKQEIIRLCECLDVLFNPNMVTGSADTQQNVIPSDRPWIHNAKKKPESQSESKYDKIFDKRDKSYIESMLELDMYNNIANNIN